MRKWSQQLRLSKTSSRSQKRILIRRVTTTSKISHVKITYSIPPTHPTDSIPKSSARKHCRKKIKINGSEQPEGFPASY